MNHFRFLSFFLAGILMFTGSARADYVPATSKVKLPEPIREFRGAWIATVHNIDWPSKKGLPAPQQRAELINLLDLAAATGINAVVLQVRSECDAIYPSKIEPWSNWISGTMGVPPSDGYDPLAFAIEEAHRRGIELHAWFNPFRSSATDWSKKSSRHISKTHPSLMMRAATQVWANPGVEFVQNRALQVIQDVTQRYDIDAVHMDDYFYPYPKTVNGVPRDQFDDSSTYNAYKKKGGKLGLRDWRRDEINGFVNKLYRTVKSTKPTVKVGISPFGIWRPGHPPAISAGLDAYEQICADSRKWLMEGWVDYFSPQLYWRITDKPHSFTVLTEWWSQQNKHGRHLWPGMASSRVMSTTDPGRPASEITDEIDVTRKYAANKFGAGHIHWSFKAIVENRGGLNKKLATSYRKVALTPASPWLGTTPPGGAYVAPTEEAGSLVVKFQAAADARWRLMQVRQKSGGEWITLRPIPGNQKAYKFDGLPAEVAFRNVGASGILSSPTVLIRK